MNSPSFTVDLASKLRPGGQPPAADRDRLTGDGRGLIGAEPDHRGGNLRGAADPLHGQGAPERLAAFVRQGGEPVAEDWPRRDRVAADTLLRAVQRGAPGKPDDGVLAGALGGEARHAPQPAVEDMLTMAPPPPASIAGISY